MTDTMEHSPQSSNSVMIGRPEVIPIFPLPSTVLLPGEVLPLHVFEPRYRAMVADAIASDRVIGIVESLPEVGHDPQAALRRVGCLGFIGQHADLEDGRYLVWLLGLERFRLDREVATEHAYREARVTYLPTHETSQEIAGLSALRRELRLVLPGLVGGVDQGLRQNLAEQLEDAGDAQLIAVATQILRMPSERKQELLEAPTLAARFDLLFEDLYSRMEADAAFATLDESQLN